MLVLTRKQNEKIQIGNNITITVLRMKGKTVRLGIQAPAEYGVVRGELVIDLEDSNLEDNNLEDNDPNTGEANSEEAPRPGRAVPSRRAEVGTRNSGPSWPSAASSNPADRTGLDSQGSEKYSAAGQWQQ